MNYKARLDATAKAITIGFLGLSGAIVFWLAGKYFTEHFTGDFFMIAVLVLTSAVTYLFKPLSFSIGENGLSVYRPNRVFTTPLGDIRDIRAVNYADLGWGLRLFGSGGFFGYLGVFYYRKIGRVTMYCTDRNEMLLVTTKKKRFMISPENSENFLHEWNKIKQDQN